MSAIRCSFVASVVVVAMLTACGDEVTEVTNVNASLDIVEKYKELPKCEESVYGSLKYVEDSSQVFACTSDGWVSLKGEKGAKGDEGKAGENGKNGESCTTAALGDGSGYEVKCNGKLVGTITNSKDGESCTTKAVEGGVEVSCPGSEPVVIKNGTNGENGTGCNVVSDKDGVVTIQCGEGENAKTTELYKAVCGTKPFDPKHQFCFDNGVYNQCGDKVYDPFKEFCSNEVIYDLCGGKAYDPELQSCTKVQFADNTEQYYKTVTIARVNYSKTWMAENLNYKTENSWCGGGSGTKEGDCSVYGRLYTWAAAVGKTETECGYGQECNLGTGDIRGVCPEGWHLPSKEEWEDLIKAVGGQSKASAKLKSKTGWKKEYSGEDAFGFTALPAGYRSYGGSYFKGGNNAYFWSSTEFNGAYAYLMDLDYDYGNVYLDNNGFKKDGYSVRCLKD